MKKLWSTTLLMISLLFISNGLKSQDSKATSNFIKAFFPNISDIDLKSMVFSMTVDEPYGLGKDSKKQEGIPEGTITKYNWVDKKIYPGNKRDYWLYIPKQYDPSKPACLMVFQDGINRYLVRIFRRI